MTISKTIQVYLYKNKKNKNYPRILDYMTH